MTAQRGARAGVTLVEVLTGLALFAVLGSASFAVIGQITRTDRVSEQRLARLSDLQRAFFLLEMDAQSAVPGRVRLAARDLVLQRTTPDGVVDIAYSLGNGALLRRRASQDGAPDQTQILLTGLRDGGWRLHLPSDGWRGADAAGTDLPDAVELTLDFGAQPPLRRVVLLPRAALPNGAP
jgi:prepilin-type N-terminal cleavage/methylation domain-containing protein